MATDYSVIQVIQAPLNRMAELLRTTLAQHSFRIDLVNDEFCELTAQLVKSERLGNTTWNYEYHFLASWEPANEGTTLLLKMNEKKNKKDPKCKTYCDEIMQGILDRARKLQTLEKTQPKPSRYGTARWATLDDVKEAGYWGGYEDSKRFIISPGVDEEYVTLTAEDTVKHTIVCGPTGSGKTSAIFIPNLIDRLKTSAIVTEATAGNEAPDLYSKTAGWRWQQGKQKIFYFNPDDLTSDPINPIDVVKGYADAQDLSRLLIENTTSKNNYGDDVWPKSEANLLTILIAHAASIGENFGYIRRILREGPDGLVPILAASPVHEAREEFRGFTNTARDGFKYGVVAGLMQRLALWVNPRICALTAKTSIDLESLQKDLFTFYLAVPAQKTHLKPVAALIFNFILDQALKHEFAHPLYLSLDEFTNFGMIPAIAQKLSIIRHQNIAALLGVQDFIQLQQIYGQDDAKLMRSQPGTKIFFRPRTYDVAKSLSEMGGMTTIYERKVSSSGQIVEKESGRPLIDPAEVLAMDETAMIVFTPRTPPLMLPRFTWQDYADATCFPPLARSEVVIDERLVRECEESAAPPKWEATPKAQHKSEPKRERHREEDRERKKPEKVKEPEPEKTKVKTVEAELEPEEQDDGFGAAP
ncbi:MAG: type IV secretory system conjugative DNA transfer family protein [Candidatus Obscuribacterales bacterium]